ncbi:MAG: AAA family ATPase [Candidatus Nanoarchaeia archaeon]
MISLTYETLDDFFKEFPFIMKNLHTYFSGCMIAQNKETGKIKAFNVPKQYINKSKNLLNPYYYQQRGNEIQDKLFEVAQEINFCSFLTITDKYSLESLKRIFTKIRKINDRFNIDRIKSKNKCSYEEALKKQQNNIEISIQKEIKYILLKRIYNKAFYDLATSKGIHFEKQYHFHEERKEQQDLFKQRYKSEILEKYNSIKDKELKKRLSDSKAVQNLREIIQFRFEFNSNQELMYFKVLEFQDNSGNPHFHILTNKHIFSHLIEECLDENNYIFDNTFIFDNWIKSRKREHLFKNCSSQLQKYQVCNDLLHSEDEIQKQSFIQSCLYYVTKYLTKQPHKTYEQLLKRNLKKTHVSEFSKTISKKFSHIMKKDLSGYKKVGKFLYSQVLKTSQIEIPLGSSIDDSNFENFLHEQGLFHKSFNERFNLIENHINQYQLDKLDSIEYNKTQTKEIFEDFNLDPNLNLYSQIKSKLLSYFCLVDIRENVSQIPHNLNLTKTLQIQQKFNDDEHKIEFLNNFINNCFSILSGGAGNGKTYALEQLNHFNDENNRVIYFTKKKGALSRLNKGLKKSFDSFETYNIDNFMLKRPNYNDNSFYLKNKTNCLTSEKDLILIIDEIGQINYDELASLFASIDLTKIKKIVFAGDIQQDKPFYGNSLINDLQELQYTQTTILKKNFRSNTKIKAISSNILNHQVVNDYELINYYDEEEKLREKLTYLLNNNYIILVSSLKLRDYINQLCFSISKRKIKLVNSNYRPYGLVNGDFYEFIKYDEKKRAVLQSLETKEFKTIPYRYYKKYTIDGFAMTIDKSQGNEFENVAVMFDDYSERLNHINKLYTGVTRAKEDIKLFFQNELVKNQCLYNTLQNNDLFQFHNLNEVLEEVVSLSTLELQAPSGI